MKGLLFLFFLLQTSLYMVWIIMYDPVDSIAPMQNMLKTKFATASVAECRSVECINEYIQFFVEASYTMASALECRINNLFSLLVISTLNSTSSI